jgi:hypothetical protein
LSRGLREKSSFSAAVDHPTVAANFGFDYVPNPIFASRDKSFIEINYGVFILSGAAPERPSPAYRLLQ